MMPNMEPSIKSLYWEFDARFIASSRLPSDLASLYRVVNVLGFIVGGTVIWLFAFPILEMVARLTRTLVAPHADRAAWQEVLYRSLRWSAVLAILGAVLWVLWIVGFYRMEIDFYTVSWSVGIPHSVACMMGCC